jgi:hypothetical protein
LLSSGFVLENEFKNLAELLSQGIAGRSSSERGMVDGFGKQDEIADALSQLID